MIKTNDSLGETPESSQSFGKFLGIGLVILALFGFLSEEKTNKISIAGIKKRKSKRLFYMLDTGRGLTTVSRQEATNIKKSSPNRLHAVWALTADDARALIGTGQGERYTQSKKLDFAGHLLNCIGWQQVISKKGNNITRCFIYAPNCKTKACIRETEQRKAEGWKPKAKANIPSKKEYRISRMYDVADKAEKTYKEGGTNIDWSVMYRENADNYASGKWDSAFETANKDEFKQYDQDYKILTLKAKGLQGVNLSCKQYVRDAYNKLRCKKYALTCNSENECSTQTAPIPWKQTEVEYTDKAIKSVAKVLAEEMNQSIDDTKRVMRRIKYHGGIAPYTGGYLQEEYRDIPTKYKSKEGIKLDELAQEMEMNESELVEAIGKAEEARSRLPRGKRRFSVKDLMFDAESYLAKQQEGTFGYIPKIPKYIPGTYKNVVKPFRTKHGTAIFWMDPRVKTDREGRRYWLLWTRGGDKYETYDIKDFMLVKKPEKKIAEKGGQMTFFGEIKKGDVVEYGGGLWEVAWINKGDSRGFLRLQKGSHYFDKNIDRVNPENVKLTDVTPEELSLNESDNVSINRANDRLTGALRRSKNDTSQEAHEDTINSMINAIQDLSERQKKKYRYYLEANSPTAKIPLAIDDPKHIKEAVLELWVTQPKTIMANHGTSSAGKYDFTIMPIQRKPEKKIAEKGGQMTFFGRMVARKIAMRA